MRMRGMRDWRRWVCLWRWLRVCGNQVWGLSSASRAGDDTSASLIGSWRGTRRRPGLRRCAVICRVLPGGVAMEAGASAYVTGANFGNGTLVETGFVGTWVSEERGNLWLI